MFSVSFSGHANWCPSVKKSVDAPQLIILDQISWGPLNNYQKPDSFLLLAYSPQRLKRKRRHDSINFNETSDSFCNSGKIYFSLVLLMFISNTFLHLERRKIIFLCSLFLHFSCVLKNNCIAFSLLRLFFNKFILRWYCTKAEANKNQPLITINMAKSLFFIYVMWEQSLK